MQNTPFFAYEQNPNDLSVQFYDRSLGSSVGWLWEFGINSIGTLLFSAEQNPIITFDTPAVYPVTLNTSFLDDGATDTTVLSYTREIIVGFNNSIEDYVGIELPGIVIAPETLAKVIMKWQLYLKDALSIPNEDVFKQQRWPPLANILISKLIVYDELVKQGNAYMQSGNTTRSVKGSVRKIETGPVNAEWNPASEQWSTLFKGKDTGFLDFLENDICIYATRLGVLLPMCKLKKRVTLFSVAKQINPKRHRLC